MPCKVYTRGASGGLKIEAVSYDGHGSVRSLTDDAGAVTDTYAYDAFGTLITRTGETPNEYLYAGERFDAETGMYHLRARYMRLDTGRFWSRDTYEGSAFDPSSLHKYSYVSGNPVNGVDPSGRMGEYSIGGLMMATAMLATIATLSVIAFQQTRELFTDSTPLADFLPQLKPEVTPQQQPEPTPQPGTWPRIPPPDEDDDLRIHRGSIRAQGPGISFGNNYVDLGDGVIGNKDTISWKWSQTSPLKLAAGLAGLEAVKSKLSKSQLSTRNQAFSKAEKYMWNSAANGGSGPPGRSFQNEEVRKRRGRERVDVVINVGLAFVF